MRNSGIPDEDAHLIMPNTATSRLDLAIYVPRIEASMQALRGVIVTIIRRYKSLSLPLPREFCRLSILNPGRAVEMLREFGNSFVRLWGWVPRFLREVMAVEPSAVLDCYESVDRLRRSISLGVDIARLILRYRLSGRIDHGEWLRLFRDSMGGVSLTLPRQLVVVVDDYVQFIENAAKFNDAVLLGPLVPTPVDLMALISMGKLSINYLAEAVTHTINYLGNYVVMGRDLTEAFYRLINDRDYIDFIKSIGLPMIT